MNQLPGNPALSAQSLAQMFSHFSPGGPGAVVKASADATARIESTERMRPVNLIALNFADPYRLYTAADTSVALQTLQLPIGFMWSNVTCTAEDEKNFLVRSFTVGALPVVLNGSLPVNLSSFMAVLSEHIDRIAPYILRETIQSVNVDATIACVYNPGANDPVSVRFHGFNVVGIDKEFACTMQSRTQPTLEHSVGFVQALPRLRGMLASLITGPAAQQFANGAAPQLPIPR